MIALTRWRLGIKRRFVMAVTWVPIPPCFLGLPLRQMMLPFMGPLPVTSQNFAINESSKRAQNLAFRKRDASVFQGFSAILGLNIGLRTDYRSQRSKKRMIASFDFVVGVWFFRLVMATRFVRPRMALAAME